MSSEEPMQGGPKFRGGFAPMLDMARAAEINQRQMPVDDASVQWIANELGEIADRSVAEFLAEVTLMLDSPQRDRTIMALKRLNGGQRA